MRLAAIPVILALAAPLPAIRKFPDFPVREAPEYVLTAAREGFVVGVQPVEDPEEQKMYFGTGLSGRGFLPVFVVLKNGSDHASYLFEKGNVGFAGASGPGPAVRSKTGEGMVMLSALGPGLIAISMIASATQMQENLIKKEVQSRTLPPGSSAHGFLYIPVARKGAREKIHLQIPVTTAGSGETFVLNLEF